MKRVALISALLAGFSFSSAYAQCDWMKNSTRVNYANKVETTERQVAEQAPVVELEKGKEVVSVTTTPASGTN